MAQRVIEGTDAKLKKALLDKEAELRRSLDDADRCSTLLHVAYNRQRHGPAGLSQALWRLGPGRSHLHRD
jgi:hypothetical protein